MKTINGKLIDREFDKKQEIDRKLEEIVEQINKLEQLSVQNLNSHQTGILALKSLNQELNSIETNRVDSIQQNLRSIQQGINRKIIFLVSITVFGSSFLSTWLMTKNRDSFCQAKYPVETTSKLFSFFSSK